MIADGPGLTNVLHRPERPESLAFYTMASHRFANADPSRYPPSNEDGGKLIICNVGETPLHRVATVTIDADAASILPDLLAALPAATPAAH